MELNDFINKEEIKKEMEKKKAGADAGDSRFWRIPDGKSTIRLLPRMEAKVPWKTVYSHRYNKNGEKLFSTCLLTFGRKDCPLCKQSWKMHENEDKSVQDMGYEARRTPRYLFNCYIVNDPDKPENNNTIKIISVGKKMFDLILESYNSEDLGDAIFNAVEGVDFEINRKKSGDNPNFPDYSSSRFIFRKYGVVNKWEKITDKLINIDELVPEESPEEMVSRWRFLGFSDAPSTTPKQEKPSTPKNKPAKTEEEGDEEEIDIDALTAEEDNEVGGDSDAEDIDLIDKELEDELNSLK